MEKYKSKIIKANDLRVYTDRRWAFGRDRIDIVRVKHYPTGKEVSVEDKSQLKAYNIAIKELEKMLKEGECKHYNDGYCYYFSDNRTKEFCENMCEHNCGKELNEECQICINCEHEDDETGDRLFCGLKQKYVDADDCCQDYE